MKYRMVERMMMIKVVMLYADNVILQWLMAGVNCRIALFLNMVLMGTTDNLVLTLTAIVVENKLLSKNR